MQHIHMKVYRNISMMFYLFFTIYPNNGGANCFENLFSPEMQLTLGPDFTI